MEDSEHYLFQLPFNHQPVFEIWSVWFNKLIIHFLIKIFSYNIYACLHVCFGISFSQNSFFKNTVHVMVCLHFQPRMMNPAQPATSAAVAGGPSVPVMTSMTQVEREKVYQWISELTSPDTRENALQELG